MYVTHNVYVYNCLYMQCRIWCLSLLGFCQDNPFLPDIEFKPDIAVNAVINTEYINRN